MSERETKRCLITMPHSAHERYFSDCPGVPAPAAQPECANCGLTPCDQTFKHDYFPNVAAQPVDARAADDVRDIVQNGDVVMLPNERLLLVTDAAEVRCGPVLAVWRFVSTADSAKPEEPLAATDQTPPPSVSDHAALIARADAWMVEASGVSFDGKDAYTHGFKKGAYSVVSLVRLLRDALSSSSGTTGAAAADFDAWVDEGGWRPPNGASFTYARMAFDAGRASAPATGAPTREQIARALFALPMRGWDADALDRLWAKYQHKDAYYRQADAVLALYAVRAETDEGDETTAQAPTSETAVSLADSIDNVGLWADLHDAITPVLDKHGYVGEGASWNADDIAQAAVEHLRLVFREARDGGQ